MNECDWTRERMDDECDWTNAIGPRRFEEQGRGNLEKQGSVEDSEDLERGELGGEGDSEVELHGDEEGRTRRRRRRISVEVRLLVLVQREREGHQARAGAGVLVNAELRVCGRARTS